MLQTIYTFENEYVLRSLITAVYYRQHSVSWEISTQKPDYLYNDEIRK